MHGLTFLTAQIVLGLAGLFIAVPLDAAELLRWNWKVGEQLQVEIRQASGQETTVGERVITLSGNQRLVAHWTVEDVTAEGDAKLVVVVQSLQVNLDLGELGKIDFDSSLDREPAGLTRAVAAPLRAIIGAKIVHLVSASGETSETVFPDAAHQAIDANPMTRRMFQGIFSEMTHQATFRLPSQEIEVGHEWQTTGKATTELGEVQMITQYRYRGKAAQPQADLDVIDATFQLVPGSAEPADPVRLKVTGQDSRGTIWFDPVAGRVTTAHFEQQQSLELGADEQRVLQKLRKTTDVTVEPIVPAPAVTPP